MKVKFLFDKEKDAFNIWIIINSNESILKRGNLEFSFCKNEPFLKCKKDIFKINKKLYSSKIPFIFLESLNKSWSEIEEEFFLRMNLLFKENLNEEFKGYLTTITTCSYNIEKNYFFVSLFYSLPKALLSVAHELMHFYFHKFYFSSCEKQIGKENSFKLKEALTILLNIEFGDLFLIEDGGYLEHKELRDFIKENWKKEKNIGNIIKKCITYFKGTNNIKTFN
ncbi:MAG: hypothetical protein ACP5T0_11730 [Verrucomicrobiia bacterium]